MPGAFLSAATCDRVRRLCDVYPQETVLRLTKIGKGTLHELKKRGFKPAARPLRPVPTDWGIVAPGRTALWLQQHYGASPNTIVRWRQEKLVPMIGKGHRRKKRPDDLAQILDRMTVSEAERHLGVSNTTLTKWRRQLGLATRTSPAAPTIGWAERYVEERR